MEENFFTKYIFTMDHKMIGKQFLITGMFMGIIGVMMSMLFRLEIAYPEQSFPILEFFLGKWALDGVMDPNMYLALVTIHGTIMVFFVLTAGLSGTFSNLLIPLQIGARDMASGFMNALSYWFFFLSSVIMVVSLFVEAGPASGWMLPSVISITASHARFRRRYDVMVNFYDLVCSIVSTWFFELHRYGN